ncbi:DNA alkylation repair protein [Marinovum sp.]|uniref:DNA alkylation repair protein n=1 Tax=Marinovum sp. TaxID=2024839 RepID=UPI002B268AC0|nr:DNA alkylation repair protein [Marinovum sp.]
MTLEGALLELRAYAEDGRAADMARYHKAPRPYLGVPNTAINDLTKYWRRALSVEERVTLADALWRTDIHEARIAAAKLLTQARIRPDDAVWALIASWVAEFDAWAIADHVCMAGQRRLTADPSRIDDVETWTASEQMWTRRAALVITLPWAKLSHPKPPQQVERARILGWAAGYVDDPQWFIQKAVAWWLRDLTKHAPELTEAFLAEHGDRMKPFARREAGKYLSS